MAPQIKKPSPLPRDEGLRAPWYHPASVTEIRSPFIRNPSRGSGGVHYYLLHGLGSEASSALNGLACTVSTWTASSLSSVSVAYYSSSTPLVFRL